MDRAQIVGLVAPDLEGFQQAQHLQDGDAAGGRGRHAADDPEAIGSAQGVALDRAIGGEIGERERAGPGMALHARHHLGSNRPAVEDARALVGDQAHRAGEIGVGHALALLPGRAVHIEIDRANARLVPQTRDPPQPRGQAGRHGEAVLGHRDGRFEQFAPREFAVFLVGQFQHRQGAGYADRDAGRNGFAEAERLAVAIEEHARRGAGRRRLAAVVDRDRLRRGIVVQQEAAAADSRRLRLDHPQHHLYRDRRIDGGSAAPQDLQPGVDGQRIRRRHHRLRCRKGSLHTAGRQQERQDGKQPAQGHARRATMNSRRKGKIVMPSARVG